MNQSARKQILAVIAGALAAPAFAQIPDVVSTFDANTRSMASAGAFNNTSANANSAGSNPAGLGYVSSAQLSFTFRNLPTSVQRLNGSFQNPTLTGDTGFGKRAITSFAYATPISGGTIGFSYEVNGFLDNRRFGTQLADGLVRVDNYTERLRYQADLFTVSYGRSRGFNSFGFGLVVANAYVSNQRNLTLIDPNNGNNLGNQTTDVSGNAVGVGAVIGFQSTPESSPNTTYGISLRTPITLNSNATTAGYFDRIPGQLSLGFASRVDNRGSEDFLVYGFGADYFFGGQENKVIGRENAISLNGGLEYTIHRFNAQWPLRLGFGVRPNGGNGFDGRNLVTFGFGYRPNNQKYTIDFSLAKPTNGGPVDLGIGITYSVGKSN